MDIIRLTHELSIFKKNKKFYTSCEFEIYNSNDETIEKTTKEFKLSDDLNISFDSAEELATIKVEEWRFDALNDLNDLNGE